MGVRLSTITDKVVTGEVTFAEEVVAFGYMPGRFTPEMADEFTAKAEEVQSKGGPEGVTEATGKEMDETIQMLAPLIAWVDVLDDDDQRIPPTPENMRRWPFGFLMALMDGVLKGQEPGGSKG